MMKPALFGLLLTGLYAAPISAEPTETTSPKNPPVKATFAVTGLHCPPCTQTVESSLKALKGVRTAKVDWKTKTAHIEFDQATVSAQSIAQHIATTPHMMGKSMHYEGWLSLRAPAVKDKASGQAAEKALASFKGVKTVKAYPEQHTIAVQFSPKGDLKTGDLQKVLKDAGITSETY
jgi:copper chaperone CopZ